jgi:glycerol uptake facilitator-like aquaporin
VTLARAASDTFAGIRPVDVPGFITAQLAGAIAATATFSWLVPGLQKVAPRVLEARRADTDRAEAVPHEREDIA